MISYSIKEVTDEYTYVVFTNEDGKSVGQLFDGSPDEAEIMVKGADVLPETKAPSLAELKEDQRDAINFRRDVLLSGGFPFMGYTVDSDAQSRANIMGEALAAEMLEPFPAGYTWRMANNVSVPMTAADVQNMARALRVFTITLYQRSWALKAAVDAATTPAALEAIPLQ